MSTSFVGRRLLLALLTVLVILLTGFLLIHIAPGDPVLVLAGEHGDAAYYAFMRHRFGLDRPLATQLVAWFAAVARGDLGFSYVYGESTLRVIAARVPATLLLTGSALAISLIIAIPLGALAAARAPGPRDTSIAVVALVLYSAPPFWVGQLAMLGLSLHLGWFPVQGMMTASLGESRLAVWDIARHLALPALVLAMQEVAVFMRVTRQSLLDELPRDHIRTARAKGATEFRTLVRHAMPRALLPIVTLIGTRVGHLVAGAAVVEIVFGWPGLGRLLLASLQTRDTPILLGLFLVVALSVVLANLLSEVVHASLDPRIRAG